MDECIFCKIINGQVPSAKVYEDDQVFAFKDNEPRAPVHILIVPKKHIESLASIEDADMVTLGQILAAAKKIAVEMNIDAAYKITMNSGKGAGQVVMHMHFHLLGGWKNISEVKSEMHQ